jgi:CheY-like chemotaxis protein
MTMSDHNSIGEARLVRDLEALAPVTSTKTLLSQLFIHLLVKAAQAIPAGNPSEEPHTLRSRTLDAGTEEAQRSDSPSPRETSKIARPLDQRPRVLFIDDEPRIGEAFRRLTRRRFEALTTTSAEEALQWIEEGEEFAVIFSDLFMPGITGVDFYERLHQSNPELAKRVVLITGGAFTDKARMLITEHHIPHIFKPFDLGKIEEVIEHILEKASSFD